TLGEKTVRVTVHDNANMEVRSDVKVINVDLEPSTGERTNDIQVTLSSFSGFQAVEGQAFTIPVATYSDAQPPPNARYSATVHGGDGTGHSIDLGSNPSGTITASHVYADVGPPPVDLPFKVQVSQCDGIYACSYPRWNESGTINFPARNADVYPLTLTA